MEINTKIPKDAYYIVLAEDKEYFLHDNEKQDGWIPKKGHSGAPFWKQSFAKRLLRAIKKNQGLKLELISVEAAMKEYEAKIKL